MNPTSSATIQFYNQGSGVNCQIDSFIQMQQSEWYMPATPIQMAQLSGNANQIFAWVGYSGQVPVQNWASSVCLPAMGWLPPSLYTDQSAYWFNANQSGLYHLVYFWNHQNKLSGIMPGWNMVNFNNPTNTRISSVLSGLHGDQVFVWQGSGWSSATFLSGLGWLGDPEVQPMQGAWLHRL